MDNSAAVTKAALQPDHDPLASRSDDRGLSVITLVRYLSGSRPAILALATHPSSLFVGMLFVFSAGLAREYDGEDLLHEPWHLLIPFAASLATSFVLFVIMDVIATVHRVMRGLSPTYGTDPLLSPTKGSQMTPLPQATIEVQSPAQTGLVGRYRVFLSLYWLTAPLAWLYAIPMERLLGSERDAASANLWLLAAVAFWRVLLITRVCSVLYRTSFAASFFPVMLFADSLAIGIMRQIPVDILVMMGGVRMTDSELSLAEAKLLVVVLGTLSWPIWAIGSLYSFFGPKWSWTVGPVTAPKPVNRTVWLIAVASIVLLLAILPWTQPEQQLRYSVEHAVETGRYRDAVDILSAHQQTDFPPFWNPPPRVGFRNERLRILKIIAALRDDDSPWVRKVYFDKMNAALGTHFPMETLWMQSNATEIVTLLEQSSEGKAILKDKVELLEIFKQLSELSAQDRSSIDRAFILAATLPAEINSSAWSDDNIREWSRFLCVLSQVEDRSLVRRIHEDRLERLLRNKDSVPPVIWNRVQQIMETEK